MILRFRQPKIIVLCLLCSGLVLVLMAGNVTAQQPATQAIPQTRTPQTSAQPYQQNSNVQVTDNQSLLTGNGQIKLPAGKPIAVANHKDAPSKSSQVWIWAAAITGLLSLVLLWAWRKSGQAEVPTVSRQMQTEQQAEAMPIALADEPAVAQRNPAKKGVNAKAKRSKRKRKRR